MKKINYIFTFSVCLFLTCCVNKQEKKEYIQKNLQTTNNHVSNGSWYSFKSNIHGDLIVPEILKDETKIMLDE